MSNLDHRSRIQHRIYDRILILTQGITKVACRILTTDLGFETELRTQSGDQILILTVGITQIAYRILTTDLSRPYPGHNQLRKRVWTTDLGFETEPRTQSCDQILILTRGITKIAYRISTTDLGFETESTTELSSWPWA